MQWGTKFYTSLVLQKEGENQTQVSLEQKFALRPYAVYHT